MSKRVKDLEPFDAVERAKYIVGRSHLYALCAASQYFVIMTNSAKTAYWVQDPSGDAFDARGWGNGDAHEANITVAIMALRKDIESGRLDGFSPGESDRIHQDIMFMMGQGPLPF